MFPEYMICCWNKKIPAGNNISEYPDQVADQVITKDQDISVPFQVVFVRGLRLAIDGP